MIDLTTALVCWGITAVAAFAAGWCCAPQKRYIARSWNDRDG